VSRRDPLRLGDYLDHILQAIANIREYTVGLDRAAYLKDRKTQDAVIRNFEVIGEACNKVATRHGPFAAAHADVRWTTAYEIQNDLPVLDAAVKAALPDAGK